MYPLHSMIGQIVRDVQRSTVFFIDDLGTDTDNFKTNCIGPKVMITSV